MLPSATRRIEGTAERTCVETLGLDTIAGAQLLQLKFGAAGVFQSDQAVLHGGRRARFIRISNGAAIIQHWGASHAVAVPIETLSLPPERHRSAALPASAGVSAHEARITSRERPALIRSKAGWLPRHHPQRRPMLHP